MMFHWESLAGCMAPEEEKGDLQNLTPAVDSRIATKPKLFMPKVNPKQHFKTYRYRVYGT